MEFLPTIFEGCYLIRPKSSNDARGQFVKTFHHYEFNHHGIDFQLREQFYSISHKNVLRGLHFQIPPCQHLKLVSCIQGKILDVVVDLRRGTSTYGQHQLFELSGENKEMLLIPIGFAHGFLSLEDNSVMLYNVSSEYSRDHDKGIHWRTAGIDWPADNPIVSERDEGFPALKDFESPFVME
ncbi:dTDP-4-dehydrorhamnose 3,5-epimerase [Paenibacillus turpanensis]|uniref:dTDP-4-dehydrorhamnose 3,5-epimerase n=1 Tax=Paenibacillus turpanensis TaxID=2689078 RepID=UPI001407D80E|nr:dTDP-4-dehydrorhamnose 3,5-epimerase [Paenibacillus turpanensis]